MVTVAVTVTVFTLVSVHGKRGQHQEWRRRAQAGEPSCALGAHSVHAAGGWTGLIQRRGGARNGMEREARRGCVMKPRKVSD